MGVWGGVDPVPVDIPRIAEQMRGAVAQWFTGRLTFSNPNTQSNTPYNALTDSGGTATPGLVWDTGVSGALIQPIKTTRRSELGSQGNDLIAIRFQTARTPSDIDLRAGMIVKVLDGGESENLGNYTFQLQENVNSSLQWGSIMEAVVMTGAGS